MESKVNIHYFEIVEREEKKHTHTHTESTAAAAEAEATTITTSVHKSARHIRFSVAFSQIVPKVKIKTNFIFNEISHIHCSRFLIFVTV